MQQTKNKRIVLSHVGSVVEERSHGLIFSDRDDSPTGTPISRRRGYGRSQTVPGITVRTQLKALPKLPQELLSPASSPRPRPCASPTSHRKRLRVLFAAPNLLHPTKPQTDLTVGSCLLIRGTGSGARFTSHRKSTPDQTASTLGWKPAVRSTIHRGSGSTAASRKMISPRDLLVVGSRSGQATAQFSFRGESQVSVVRTQGRSRGKAEKPREAQNAREEKVQKLVEGLWKACRGRASAEQRRLVRQVCWWWL